MTPPTVANDNILCQTWQMFVATNVILLCICAIRLEYSSLDSTCCAPDKYADRSRKT